MICSMAWSKASSMTASVIIVARHRWRTTDECRKRPCTCRRVIEWHFWHLICSFHHMLKISCWVQQWKNFYQNFWNLRSKWPIPFKTPRLRQISAYNVSTVRDSEKVLLWRIRSRPRAFQRAIDGMRTLPLSFLNGGSKSDFLFLKNKIQLQSNKVCYKVTLCENVQRQSCYTIIPYLTAL